MSTVEAREEALDAGIVAALDEVLAIGEGDPVLLSRLRRLVENCLADNYADTDVKAVIELAMAADGEGGDGA